MSYLGVSCIDVVPSFDGSLFLEKANPVVTFPCKQQLALDHVQKARDMPYRWRIRKAGLSLICLRFWVFLPFHRQVMPKICAQRRWCLYNQP